ncbi:AraC family transcriptional regulator [Streptomyces palmae]|uniref:AraC family transcriptional regulator n=1 Tax=Streptomyces palmae TaxID=1701085 RepID=A0A4Z0HE56_9ACTN|nr:AraC family transcriptional regulator [Streptomyces palmae]
MHQLNVPDPGVLPFAMGSFDTIGPLSRADFPHRHTFHELVYVTAGSGAHVIDLAAWPLRPPQLCLVAPGRVHHWERTGELDGRVVLFDDDFLLNHPEDREALRRLAARPVLRPTGDAARAIGALLAEMDREYQAAAPGFISVLQAYLHVLLVRAGRLAEDAPGPGTPGGSERGASVAARFAELLARPEGAARTVRDCAALLGVSVGRLQEAVKEATGTTPGRMIRKAQVLEAKRLLAGTALTVGQVARQTGFGDPAYFCRFFRRETGSSPGDFRRTVRGNHHDRVLVSIDPADPPA